jgi:hypothetical protein
MIIKPTRPDWYCWYDTDADWCRENGAIPGLRFENIKGRLAVNYHVSHVPCLPEAVVIDHNIVEQTRQRNLVLPFEGSGLLRGYQAADLQRLKLRKGALLAYGMRVGKTSLACHLHDPNDGILLAVGPLAAREVWCDWIERTTGYPPWVLYGRKDAQAAPGYGAYFCHYDVLEAHTPFLVTQKIGTLVLDEIHVLQNASRRDNAVNACVFRSSKILGLSGTPMFNKPISMYRLLHMLTPGAWGSRFDFAKFFCDAQPGAHGWLYEGQSNTDIFTARLNTIMVRRTWQEVMPELPPTVRIIESVDVTGAAYVQLEAAAMKAALAAGNASQGGYLATLRHKLAEVKIKPAKQIAEQAAADGHKVVMWVWHVKIGDKVEKAMAGDESRPVFRLQADDPAPKRQRILDAFRAHEGPCFLVASMGVGGVALDLSAADYAIFVELDWTPANVQQAEFRTFHKDRPHVVVYLHADDPVETKLVEVLDLKNSFANAIGLGFDDVAKEVMTNVPS